MCSLSPACATTQKQLHLYMGVYILSVSSVTNKIHHALLASPLPPYLSYWNPTRLANSDKGLTAGVCSVPGGHALSYPIITQLAVLHGVVLYYLPIALEPVVGTYKQKFSE